MAAHVLEDDLRKGAQALRIKCSEPAINTPKAIGRQLDFMEPYLEAHKVRVDADETGRPRWLSDPLVLPGILRSYAANLDDGCYRRVIDRSLGALISLHGPELVFLFEHQYCGERWSAWYKEFDSELPIEVEPHLIAETLHQAEQLFRDWYTSTGRNGNLIVVKAVCIVTPTKVACRRRFERVLTLDAYMQEFAPQISSSGASMSAELAK